MEAEARCITLTVEVDPRRIPDFLSPLLFVSFFFFFFSPLGQVSFCKLKLLALRAPPVLPSSLADLAQSTPVQLGHDLNKPSPPALRGPQVGSSWVAD